MKKLGLVPLLYEEYNYGGVLQFYALQKVLVELGYECEIVKVQDFGYACDLETKKTFKTYLRKLFIPIFRIKSNMDIAKINRYTLSRKEKINYFKQKYFSKMISIEDYNLLKRYDAVICGSDQIWNPKWAKKRTFLTFVPDEVNKVIYAASLGCEKLTESEINSLKPLIERINHVSVREYSAKNIIKEFLPDKKIDVVLDPTLLITSNEWEKIAVDPNIENYIFTYFLGEYHQYHEFIMDFAKKRNLKIVNIPYSSIERIDKDIFGDIQIYDASPEEFIGLIKNASVIFTDSFHACVFSTLFEKSFYVFERKSSGNMIGRIKTLQEHFGIKDRIITLDSKINLNENIDYSKKDIIQSQLIFESLNYIKESIEDFDEK